MNEEKKKQDTSDVDSDEHSQGKEIETGEENLPSKAAAVHEVIRMEGEKELDRDGQASCTPVCPTRRSGFSSRTLVIPSGS